MNLVGYSDSEGSDNEAPPPASKLVAKPAAAPPKSTAKKVVDKANPRKIQVDLPYTVSTDKPTQSDDITADAPPAKRAKVGGGGFSGFNALLPAPKGRALAGDGAKKGLGRGVNLRTGAAPGFSRETVPEEVNNVSGATDEGLTTTEPVGTSNGEKKAVDIEPEVKIVGKATRFMPLSVSRGKQKKKKPVVAAAASAGESRSPQVANTQATSAPIPPPKPKVSLFSISNEEIGPTSGPTAAKEEYRPMMYGFEEEEAEEDAGFDEPYQNHSYAQPPPISPQPSTTTSNSLDAIASDLNLTEQQRRHLFGRKGTKDMQHLSAAKIVNFNTDEEYAANEALRANGETVKHNPVRALASGKHSLKQLVSAASNQKDALEEQFATQKGNRKEAGGRYGW